jgi:hypothetical protein
VGAPNKKKKKVGVEEVKKGPGEPKRRLRRTMMTSL